MYAFINCGCTINRCKLLVRGSYHSHRYLSQSQITRSHRFVNQAASLTLRNRFTCCQNAFLLPACSTLNNSLFDTYRFCDQTYISYRYLHKHSSLFYAEGSKASSKVEETVQALKEKEKDKALEVSAEGSGTDVAKPKKTLKQKVIDEIMHYYHGFKLLFIDMKVSIKLVWRILRGYPLTRREHNLLVRTVSDMFRLVPFSVFIIVPFMEFLLPFFIKFFPGMLPSTFQTDKDKEHKLKQSLRVKIEMAKFLQETLDNMSVKAPGHYSKDAKSFAEFFEKVRSEGGGLCTSEEIMKFSKLFEDEITLDSLPRPQLVALCRVLEIQPIGTSSFLRFQLRMKIRSLIADDAMIQKEGIDSLTLSELQAACRARGMRAYGLSTERLKFQLAQWLDLSLNKKVPPSLLLLSRAFMLPETIPTIDKLKATISALPETVAVSTKAAIGEREGKVDNKTKIEIIREEERRIQEERKEINEEKRKERELEEKEKLKREAEELVDKASVLVDKAIDLEPNVLRDSAKQTQETIETLKRKIEGEEVNTEDIQTLENAIEALANQKKTLLVEKEELQELKEELADYKEDVEDLNEALKTADEKAVNLKESRAAKTLFKKVNSMIHKMDEVLVKLENKEQSIKETIEHADDKQGKVEAEDKEVLRIDELMDSIRKIQKVPDESKLERIEEVLGKIDEDQDGAVRLDIVLKVLELIGTENVKLSTKQIEEIIHLLEKEEALEVEEEIDKALSKKIKSEDQDKTQEAKPKSDSELNQKLKIPETVVESTGKNIPPTEEVFKEPKTSTKSKTL